MTEKYNEKVEIFKREQLYQGFLSLERLELKFQRFDGAWSEMITREIAKTNDFAGILLYDPLLNQLIFIEQFRCAMMRDDLHPWAIEIVAGILDSGQTPAQVAEREAEEEAGLKLQAIEPICNYWVNIGSSPAIAHLFIGKVDASLAGGVFGLACEHEDIKSHVIDYQQACDWLATGKLNNSPSIIAMQWLQLNKQHIDERWK